MKLAEFDALCEREWERTKGDLVELYLTDDSREELHRDMLMAPQREKILSLTENDIRKIREGEMFRYVVSQITRSQVTIHGGSGRDYAIVRYIARCDD